MHEPAILSRRAAAALPLAALFGPAAAAHATPCPAGADAALVDLGRRWEAALVAENAHYALWSDKMTSEVAAAHDATGNGLYAARDALFCLIEKTPAATPAGLAVKARVLAFENDVEMNEASIAAALAASRYFADRVAMSLALDVLRMARLAA